VPKATGTDDPQRRALGEYQYCGPGAAGPQVASGVGAISTQQRVAARTRPVWLALGTRD
jgi:hypothetical protein